MLPPTLGVKESCLAGKETAPPLAVTRPKPAYHSSFSCHPSIAPSCQHARCRGCRGNQPTSDSRLSKFAIPFSFKVGWSLTIHLLMLLRMLLHFIALFRFFVSVVYPLDVNRCAKCVLGRSGPHFPGGPARPLKSAWDHRHLTDPDYLYADACLNTVSCTCPPVSSALPVPGSHPIPSASMQPSPKRLIGFSKKATTLYMDVEYRESDWLLFGSETQGFPEAAVGAISREGALVRIPMSERHVRSLNLSVSVGIGLFESLRQLEAQQTLHHSSQLSLDPVPGVAAGQGVTMRTQ